MNTLDKFLFKRIDNAPLVVFRIIFGLLITLEAFGAIATGWVRSTLVDPQFTFTFIGFEFLQPLPGYGMYGYYVLMGLAGLGVLFGYRYRLSVVLYTILWAGVYFMQKSSYNNHYYLLLLILLFMCFLPAHRYASADVRRQPELKRLSMPAWCRYIIIGQLFIVYTYASVAKWHPDWVNLNFVRTLMLGKKDLFLVGEFLQQTWVHFAIAWFGILYDLLIVPLLLFRPTRIWALAASVFFHLFNSLVLHIGIFPYLALAFTLFFFEPETIRRVFLKNKPPFEAGQAERPPYFKPLLALAVCYFILQLVLPLRHHLIEGDVLYTEEGHRLSWRMMLRSKAGSLRLKVVDKGSGEVLDCNWRDWLSEKQRRVVPSKPDMIWQLAQRIKTHYAQQGIEVSVYATYSKISVNGRYYQDLIDPQTDLAAVPWHWMQHEPWIIATPQPELMIPGSFRPGEASDLKVK